MKSLGVAIWVTAGALLVATPVFPQAENSTGQGQAVVTVLPKHHSELTPNITQQNLKIKVNGKESSVTNWVPLHGQDDRLELIMMIDSSAHNLNGRQLDEIKAFILGLPPHTKLTLGYMENGSTHLTGPLTTDHAQVANGLHMLGGMSIASPYFCLSDLAKHWPSTDREARREVVMVTDGKEPYNQGYDPNNTYVQAATNDSTRAGLVVYSIYWSRWNRTNSPSRDMYNREAALFSPEESDGQNYLITLTRATGGFSYGYGMGNPISFKSYLEDIALRLEHQYKLSFTARLDGKPEIKNMKLKAGGIAAEITTPEQVLIDKAVVVAE
jgi:hypothetical protein